LTLAHIWEPFLGRGAAEGSALERTEGQQLLERERELASVDARLVVRGEVPVGVGLHQLAEEEHADLIVVGSTRHALLGRVLMGDDCRASLDGAPCAVAVAPRGYEHVSHRLRRLGVGYDDSPESRHALRAARELAELHGAQIAALWVASLQDVREEQPIPAGWPEEINELVSRHSERLAELEGVQGTAIYGGPREELAQFGKTCDLLVLGSRNYGPIGRFFHGTVARYLLRHATCPLLVLPREQAVDESGSAALEREAQTPVGAGR
jgi:nucleotide-binding universal stress UspA family protein